MDHLFFPTFCVLIFSFLISIAMEMRQRRQDLAQSQINAARLEIELLKKHIQPHFLMNTLTSLMEWLEDDPKTAARMVQALGEELQVLNQISGEKLIPLQLELDLCRAHLEVMGLRKDCRYALLTSGIDPQARIPPAIFHTLLENGITHGSMPPGEVRFHLQAETEAGTTRYRMRTPLPDHWKPKPELKEGTGMRYLKMRLEESFLGRWRMTQEPVSDYWQTTIEVETEAA